MKHLQKEFQMRTGDGSENKPDPATEMNKYEKYLARFQRYYQFNYLEQADLTERESSCLETLRRF